MDWNAPNDGVGATREPPVPPALTYLLPPLSLTVPDEAEHLTDLCLHLATVGGWEKGCVSFWTTHPPTPPPRGLRLQGDGMRRLHHVTLEWKGWVPKTLEDATDLRTLELYQDHHFHDDRDPDAGFRLPERLQRLTWFRWIDDAATMMQSGWRSVHAVLGQRPLPNACGLVSEPARG